MDGLEVIQQISETLLALLGEQQRISSELNENNYLMRENTRTMSNLIRELRERAAVTAVPYSYSSYPIYNSPYTNIGGAKWEAPKAKMITYSNTSEALPDQTGLSGITCEISNAK